MYNKGKLRLYPFPIPRTVLSSVFDIWHVPNAFYVIAHHHQQHCTVPNLCYGVHNAQYLPRYLNWHNWPNHNHRSPSLPVLFLIDAVFTIASSDVAPDLAEDWAPSYPSLPILVVLDVPLLVVLDRPTRVVLNRPLRFLVPDPPGLAGPDQAQHGCRPPFYPALPRGP